MANSEGSSARMNQRKASLLRNISGPVLSTVGGVVSTLASANFGKVGCAAEVTALPAVDDSASGAGLLQGFGLSSGGDKAATAHAARLPGASSGLGSLFKRT